MKIVVINPPDKNTVIELPNHDGESYLEADDYGYFPPLGALYVLSYLEKNDRGNELYFFDCPAEQMDHSELKQRLETIQPDVVGLTSFTVSLVDVALVAKSAKEVNPSCHVCLGGHHAIAYPHEATQLANIDSVIVGEGEFAFTELIKALKSGSDITQILGVYTKESILRAEAPKRDGRFLNKVIVKPAYVDDVNKLPFPNRKFIQHLRYSSIVGVTNRLTTILSSRGCPFACTFCNVPYKKYRERDAASVVDEIEECLALGYKEFHFYDDLFNITEQKVIRFCDELDKRKLRITWDFRGRVNAITRKSLERAKKTGLRMISFGVETGNDEGLKALRKGTNVKQIKEAFEICRELGIISIADYMIGLPNEKTWQDVIDNVDFLIYELNPDFGQFNVLTLYPHTQAYDQAVEKGLIEPGRWQKFALNPQPNFVVDHWEEHLSISELVKLHRLAYRKFYFRTSFIFKSALKLRTPYEFVARFRGALKLLNP